MSKQKEKTRRRANQLSYLECISGLWAGVANEDAYQLRNIFARGIRSNFELDQQELFDKADIKAWPDQELVAKKVQSIKDYLYNKNTMTFALDACDRLLQDIHTDRFGKECYRGFSHHMDEACEQGIIEALQNIYDIAKPYIERDNELQDAIADNLDLRWLHDDQIPTLLKTFALN